MFTVWAWPSHLYPIVPTAWACWTAGHEVIVATQPGLRGTVRGTGLPSTTVGGDVDVPGMFRERLAAAKDGRGRLSGVDPHDEVRVPGAADPRTMVLDVYAALARSMTPDTVELARQWGPDTIVWDPITFAGAIAARATGARSVRHLWGLDSTRYLGLDRDWTPDLCELLTEHGVLDGHVAEDVSLDVCPPRLQLDVPGPRRVVRYVPYNGTDGGDDRELPPPGRPRVCVTWGSTVEQLSGSGEFPAAEVLRALAGHDVEVLVAASDEQVAAIGPLPANVTATGWMPLRATLPTCSAVVHEGGAGTSMTASLLGVPQLILPALHEQILVAERLAATGAGRHLPPAGATATAVDEHLGPLLDPGTHRSAAADLRRNVLDQPPLADVACRWADLTA